MLRGCILFVALPTLVFSRCGGAGAFFLGAKSEVSPLIRKPRFVFELYTQTLKAFLKAAVLIDGPLGR
jgi:hypothetical protein